MAACKHGGGLGAQQGTALIDPVGKHASQRGEQHGRRELQCEHDSELDGRPAQQQDEPRLADRLHPGADQADDLAREIELVVPVPQRAEPALEATAGRAGQRSGRHAATQDAQRWRHAGEQDPGQGGERH